MFPRGPSISQPGISVSQPGAAPVNLAVEGQPDNQALPPVAALPFAFDNNEDWAQFPPLAPIAAIAAGQPAANPAEQNDNDAVIDVQHDQAFSEMLRAVELEEKLAVGLKRYQSFHLILAALISSFNIVIIFDMIATPQYSIEEIDHDFFDTTTFLGRAIHALIYSHLFLLFNYITSIGMMKNIKATAYLNEQDCNDVAELTFFNAGNISASNLMKELEKVRSVQSLEIHGNLATFTIDDILKRLNVGLIHNRKFSKGDLAIISIAGLLLSGAFIGYEIENPRSLLVMELGVEILNAYIVLQLAKLLPAKTSYYLNNQDLAIVKAALGEDVKELKASKVLFDLKKATARPLTEAAKIKITHFSRRAAAPDLGNRPEGVELQQVRFLQ